MTRNSTPARARALTGAAGGDLAATTASATMSAPGLLTIAAQGSYAAGGSVYEAPGIFDPHAFFCAQGGQNHGDHAYVRYQRPVRPRALPMVMWHGGGQFMRTWETTPDGREGYDTIMLRRDWEVHLMDQPRRGGAGHANDPGAIIPLLPHDRSLWHIFRLGVHPELFPNTAFPKGADALNQYWRQRVDDTGASDLEVLVAAGSAVFDRVGNGILISHSASGVLGFVTAVRNANVQAIVSYEPGTVVVPEGYEPRPLDHADSWVAALTTPLTIPETQFDQLAKIPVHIVFGDNIPTSPSPYAGLEFWRLVRARTEEFCDLINSRGGDATILDLPDAGLVGNTHFPFSDLNNLAVADQLSSYLKSRNLDGYR